VREFSDTFVLKMSKKERTTKMQGTKMSQSQNWCFTHFATEKHDIQFACDRFFEMAELEKTNIASVAFGLETCPTTKREHLQGFFQLYKKGMQRSRLSVAK